MHVRSASRARLSGRAMPWALIGLARHPPLRPPPGTAGTARRAAGAQGTRCACALAKSSTSPVHAQPKRLLAPCVLRQAGAAGTARPPLPEPPPGAPRGTAASLLPRGKSPNPAP